jgi:O-antigen biosynthesis protein
VKISVVIPCYNAEAYLAQTIRSALSQTRPPDELIVVDDGSTDRSREIAERLGVRVVTERTGSAALTRNQGASMASGDALMFLDADDVLGPTALEALAEQVEQYPDCLAACPWYRLAQIDGTWVRRPPSCLPRRPDQDPLDAWLRGWYHPPCSVLWSRSAYERTGGWDRLASASNDDGDLVMRALVLGTPLRLTPRGSAFYRRAPEGRSSLSGMRFSEAGLRSRIGVVERIALMLDERRRLNPYRSAIDHALRRIAEDCGERHRHLADACDDLRRHYGESPWSRRARLAGHIARSLPERMWCAVRPPPPKDPWLSAPPTEVRYGLEASSVTGPSLSPLETDDAGQPRSAGNAAGFEFPLVSIIIPTYNRRQVLQRALDSVLRQTFQRYEVLVVDDGSTDGTAAMVAVYRDPRIRYLAQPTNLGVSVARNRGLREARTPYIAFLDSDDEWMPEKLEAQVELLQGLGPEVGLTYTAVETVPESAGPRPPARMPQGDVYPEMLLNNVLHGGGSSIMIRQEVVETVGFFDEDLPAIEDYDFWLRICRRYEVAAIESPLVRIHASREGDRKSLRTEENLRARAYFYRKHGAAMREAGVAHLFLLESARRHMVPWHRDRRGARRLAIRAALLRPLEPKCYRTLVRSLPEPLHETASRIWHGGRTKAND